MAFEWMRGPESNLHLGVHTIPVGHYTVLFKARVSPLIDG